ncbi:MAG: Crp/Fnr family transcriptional regulator [Tissierellia bacterium]|nr:Crp/Fnr family transcriptional regulator [Tissierellia bacterium]
MTKHLPISKKEDKIHLACSCESDFCTAKIPLLAGLPQALQRKLVEGTLRGTNQKGEFLLEEGNLSYSIKIIRQGRVKLNRYDKEGKEFILDILSQGDIIGVDLFFESAPSNYNAICLTEVKLCEISRELISSLISSEPEVAWSMIEHLSVKLRQASNLLEILQENDAGRRIAKFLLERSERAGIGQITLSIDDMAASIGLRKETISRKITELQNEGHIKRQGQRKIAILDPQGLRSLI